jgi:hypothetical protein
MFAHYRSNFLSLHQKTLERVSRAVEGVRVKFYAGDCRDFMAQADKNGIAVCFPPTYRGGYESLYKRLDAIFEWSKPTYRVFAETDIESFAMQMSGFRHFLVSFDKPIAPLADRQIAVVQTTLRSHPVYVYGSQGARRVALPHQRVGTPRYAPRCDDVIEPIEVVLTDVPTMNTWRSQYLAKQITPSDAMRNYAVLSAGKVIGAFSVCLMKYEKPGAGFIYLLSDFAVRPSPHKRLSKLILACVLSTEVQADLEQWLCQRVENIRTTAFTAKAVSMKYRGLFEVHNREEGMINYDAPAGRWSIKDGFQWWMKNHGCKRSTPNCPAPACAAT